MLNEKDIQKLVKVFATKQDLTEFKENLPNKKDFNMLMNSVDRFMSLHEKLDQEFTIMKNDINRLKLAVHSLGGKIE